MKSKIVDDFSEHRIKEIAKIASDWWGNRVTNPEYDNGDSSDMGGICQLLASMQIKEVGNTMRGKYISHLAERIEKELEQGRLRLTLSVDYDPCKILKEVGDLVGLPINNYPWKTYMDIDKDFIRVKSGYGAKLEYLYTSETFIGD